MVSSAECIPVRVAVGSSRAGGHSAMPALGALLPSHPAVSASPLVLTLDKEFKESLIREWKKVRETASRD